MLLLLLFKALAFADTLPGLRLMQEGKTKEGIAHLEKEFQSETGNDEKARIAYVLAFASGTQSSPVYYARYALKYQKDLGVAETQKLRIRIADSFLEFGKLTEAKSIYDELLKEKSSWRDYIQYQLGYYYLNSKQRAQAYEVWSMLLGTELRQEALRSIGRYWETLGLPDGVKKLASEKAFLDGFAAAVDERQSELTTKDLDLFVKKKATPVMLTLLIEKNPLFVKAPCDFVKWYKPELALSHELVFPLISKCDVKRELPKKARIAELSAITKDEKIYLISLFGELNQKERSCQLAGDESIHEAVVHYCEEGSGEIERSVRSVLQTGDKTLLSSGKVIRSSLSLSTKEQEQILRVVGESRFAQEFFESPSSFIHLGTKLGFRDETFLLFVIFDRKDHTRQGMVRDLLKERKAKELLNYLDTGKVFQTPACTFENDTLKKIALESRLRSGLFSEDDLVCGHKLLIDDQALSAIAIITILERAQKIMIDPHVDLAREVLKDSAVHSLPVVAGGLGQEVSLLVKIQNYPVKQMLDSEKLLAELRQLKRLRQEIAGRKWSSEKVLAKAVADFHALLDKFLGANEKNLTTLNLLSKVNTFIEGMRFT